MHVHMQTAETLNPDQISQFLALGDTIEFAGQSRAERYAFAQQLLVAQEYARQGKKQRGAIRAYLSKMTGWTLPQTARLIQMYIETGAVELRGYRRHEFVNKYTDVDVRLLAAVDRAHERLSGPATCCILRREYERFESVENQTAVFHTPQRSSRRRFRLPHPNTRTQPSGVPPERQEKGRKPLSCHFSIILRWKRKSVSVSFLDWKMLWFRTAIRTNSQAPRCRVDPSRIGGYGSGGQDGCRLRTPRLWQPDTLPHSGFLPKTGANSRERLVSNRKLK